MQLDVLADQHDGDGFEEAVLGCCERFPFGPDRVAFANERGGEGELVELQDFLEQRNYALLLE